MVIELTPQVDEQELESLVARVFFKAIDLLGGLTKLAEYRTLTWLPSLARAAYAVVLSDEYFYTEDEIAERVGLTRNTVRNILRADPELALYKVQHLEELTAEEKKELRVHTAGGIAKLAYRMIKEGQEAQSLLQFCQRMTEEAVQVVCEAPWPYLVLKYLRGVTYPITGPEALAERLKGIRAHGLEVSQIVQEISYPIKTPAQLLHEIKEHLQKQELV